MVTITTSNDSQDGEGKEKRYKILVNTQIE